MRLSLIAVLLVTLAFTGWRLADVERQRYALLWGLCQSIPEAPRSLDCLKEVQPRTSRLWNLFYGLTK
ncbi:hypothetical protein EOK75_02980 [Pseudorhodobacter turbinis]|uniref:Uncharacterized protein n=1 Tax=Pseudorhodobacter turbinis TaxID=2500533 RepID=A0A4P8ED65_9RHOB|nr:hypothetical protein EOK75_02980 [Pseudorhodobacter turbinis]